MPAGRSLYIVSCHALPKKSHFLLNFTLIFPLPSQNLSGGWNLRPFLLPGLFLRLKEGLNPGFH